MHSYLWTKSRTRLQFIRSNPGYHYNWIFLPGGPGLGSEYFSSLTDHLHLPGSIWHADLPGDGSNLTEDDKLFFSNWPNALYDLTDAFSHIILVAHSSAGMFVLQSPEIEKNLEALVLLSSAADSSWEAEFEAYINNHPSNEVEELQKMYAENPSNELLRELTLASVSYFSMPKNQPAMSKLFEPLPYNMKVHSWAEQNFAPKSAKWIPKIPTLILSGDSDRITPVKFFLENPAFNKSNIRIRVVKDASHFPWIDDFNAVQDYFSEFVQVLGS